jgi:hypothetical protein
MPLFCDLVPSSLAPLAPAAPDEAVFFFYFVGSLVSLLGLVLGILAIIHFAKRKPTIDAEFATKTELHREVTGLKNSITDFNNRNEKLAQETFGKMDILTKSMNTGFLETARALGRLEGKQ